jgi:hypothetical protein
VRCALALLLPARADHHVAGSRVPLYVLGAIALLSLVRSGIHLLAADGGAGSIAGMDLSVAGAEGIVFAFALWGSSQLLMALVQLAVVVRYRSLVPAMYVLLILEVLLRMLVGYAKPVRFAQTPPGAVGNWVLLPLAGLMLAWSLWSGCKARSAET